MSIWDSTCFGIQLYAEKGFAERLHVGVEVMAHAMK